MRQTKALREYKDILEEHGITAFRVNVTSKSHYQFMVTLPSGKDVIFVCAGTTSDRRSVLNFRASVRRALRDYP